MKIKIACSVMTRVVRALEQRYGAEVLEVARKAILESAPRDPSEIGAPGEDLHVYLKDLEKACAATHEWERVVDEPDRVEYRFSRCMWAEVFRELGQTEIGRWICEGDDPGVQSYHPRLRCHLTKTLMKGDSHCNHCFYVD